MKTTFEVATELAARLQVGKLYLFDGRKGRVVSVNEPSNVDANGRVTGRPTVTVRGSNSNCHSNQSESYHVKHVLLSVSQHAA